MHSHSIPSDGSLLCSAACSVTYLESNYCRIHGRIAFKFNNFADHSDIILGKISYPLSYRWTYSKDDSQFTQAGLVLKQMGRERDLITWWPRLWLLLRHGYGDPGTRKIINCVAFFFNQFWNVLVHAFAFHPLWRLPPLFCCLFCDVLGKLLLQNSWTDSLQIQQFFWPQWYDIGENIIPFIL